MSKKIKCAFVTFALASVFALSTALSACTIKTDHPSAKITVSFNEVTYEIEYKLYRNMYPQTVQHFIELADAGFYDEMIVHDYTSGDWITGAYAYNQPENNLLEGETEDGEKLEYSAAYASGTSSLREYLETNSKEAKYYELFEKGALTPSVYGNLSYDKNNKATVSSSDALATLIGEFSSNGHEIEKNALSAKFGALKMLYYDKGNTNQQVYVTDWTGDIRTRDYKYNCATSVFSMQVGSSSYSASKYCVFAELLNDNAREVLEDLMEAIDDYSSEVTTSRFTITSVRADVDKHDKIVSGGVETSFTMTMLPLIIKSVEITKY